VDQHTVKGSLHLDRCLVGGNPLPPDLMTTEQRLDEVAQILAAGLVRLLWKNEHPNDRSRLEKNSLDFSPDRSVHATARQGRKVRR
jgi:hypothetical protein